MQFLLFAAYFMDIDLFSFILPLWAGYLCWFVFGVGVGIIVWGVISLNDNLTPMPRPKKTGDLISNGIYRFIRHPIYTGIFLSLLGYALYCQSGFRLTIACLMLLVFYYKSDYEESLLLERYEGYVAYKKKTGRFFPRKGS